jgi:hypothetical protein
VIRGTESSQRSPFEMKTAEGSKRPSADATTFHLTIWPRGRG